VARVVADAILAMHVFLTTGVAVLSVHIPQHYDVVPTTGQS